MLPIYTEDADELYSDCLEGVWEEFGEENGWASKEDVPEEAVIKDIKNTIKNGWDCVKREVLKPLFDKYTVVFTYGKLDFVQEKFVPDYDYVDSYGLATSFRELGLIFMPLGKKDLYQLDDGLLVFEIISGAYQGDAVALKVLTKEGEDYLNNYLESNRGSGYTDYDKICETIYCTDKFSKTPNLHLSYLEGYAKEKKTMRYTNTRNHYTGRHTPSLNESRYSRRWIVEADEYETAVNVLSNINRTYEKLCNILSFVQPTSPLGEILMGDNEVNDAFIEYLDWYYVGNLCTAIHNFILMVGDDNPRYQAAYLDFKRYKERLAEYGLKLVY